LKRNIFSKDEIPFHEGDEVMLLVDGFTDIGVKVIINERFEGMLYKDEVYRKLSVGEELTGYIKKIRDDNKIDVTVRKGGLQDIADARARVLERLKEQNGFLALTDNSSPELIKEKLQMSKKLFKKAIGGLYKDEIIAMKHDGIYLRKKKGAKGISAYRF
jgi:predicted RNA-binding protein (virulence factor B family)